MGSELSILIPVYNQVVVSLVETLLQQASQLSLSFEIRVYDDGSSPQTKSQNSVIASHPNVLYLELPENIGRSAIRYRLAQDAQFSSLLFLDNDVLPIHTNFLEQYSQKGKTGITVGGIVYAETCLPGAELRWKYGRKREQVPAKERQRHPYQRVFFSNLLVGRPLFLEHFSQAEVKGYGHEDTLFAWNLQKAGVLVEHIDNPVVHLGLEQTPEFLVKTKQAIYNLIQLEKRVGVGEHSRLLKAYAILKQWKLDKFVPGNSSWLILLLQRNLISKTPSLKAFDFYRLVLLDSCLRKKMK